MIFRLAWEQRVKKQCPCCDQDAPHHAWGERVEGPFYDPKDAKRAESNLYARIEDQKRLYEVRNVRVDYADSPTWREYHEWEHKHAEEHEERLRHAREASHGGGVQR